MDSRTHAPSDTLDEHFSALILKHIKTLQTFLDDASKHCLVLRDFVTNGQISQDEGDARVAQLESIALPSYNELHRLQDLLEIGQPSSTSPSSTSPSSASPSSASPSSASPSSASPSHTKRVREPFAESLSGSASMQTIAAKKRKIGHAGLTTSAAPVSDSSSNGGDFEDISAEVDSRLKLQRERRQRRINNLEGAEDQDHGLMPQKRKRASTESTAPLQASRVKKVKPTEVRSHQITSAENSFLFATESRAAIMRHANELLRQVANLSARRKAGPNAVSGRARVTPDSVMKYRFATARNGYQERSAKIHKQPRDVHKRHVLLSRTPA